MVKDRTGNSSKIAPRRNNCCCKTNESEKPRMPLHFKLIQLVSIIAAIPATTDAIATSKAPGRTNAMALLDTARKIRQQRVISGSNRDISNNAGQHQSNVERVQQLSMRSNEGIHQLDNLLEARSIPSLHQRSAAQPTTSHQFNINQFLSSDSLMWDRALFDDGVVEITNGGIDEKSMSKDSKLLERRKDDVRIKSGDTNEVRAKLATSRRTQKTALAVEIEKKYQTTDVRKMKSRQKSSVNSKIRPSRNKADDELDDGNKNSYSTSRVSHKEELQLAHIIQKGVELNNIKTKFEKKNKRDITRQEWTDLAKLGSPKEVRRIVSNYRRAKNELVMANMGLVHAVVRQRLNRSGNISYEELVQEGSLGLLRAAELFDPRKGIRFSTYATIWIKGILGNSSVGEAITLPLREKNKWKKIQRTVEELSVENNGNPNVNGGLKQIPSPEDIASRGGMRSDEVKKVMTKMKRARNVLSLDYRYNTQSRSGTESQSYDQAFSNDKNLMDNADFFENLQLRTDIVAALSRNLSPREAHLMELRYGLKDGKTRTIEECAKVMGIGRSRVQQLSKGCLKKLRDAEDSASLQEYMSSFA